MIDLKKLKLYPNHTNSLSITKEDDGSFYNIIFFPENSSFQTAYSKLNLRKMFVRYGSIAQSKNPMFFANVKTLKQYQVNKLIPIRSNKENIRNLFIDTSMFLNAFESKYRQRGSFRKQMIQERINNYLFDIKNQFSGRKNVLLYYVDLNNDISDNVFYKRGWQVYDILKNHPASFDYILMGVYNNGIISYYLLSKGDKSISETRFFTILRSVKPTINEQDIIEQDKIDTSNNVLKVLNNGEEPIDDKSDKVIKGSINNYLNTVDPVKTKNFLHSDLGDDQAHKLAITSTLYSILRDKKAAISASNSINPKLYGSVFQALKKEYVPSIIQGIEQKNQSKDSVLSGVDIHAINDNKNPSRILNKRKFDFDTTFEKDLFRSFKLLENQDTYPLKVASFKKERIPILDGDLEQNRMIRYMVILKDDLGNSHEVSIEIPEIQSDGTFMINGQKKYLEYQLVINPIFFLKPKEAELQTMYATVATHHKLTKHKSYYVSRIGGYWLPTFLMLAYSSSFDNVCKMFGITYQIIDSKDETQQNIFELDNGKFLIFKTSNEESNVLINSLKEISGTLPAAFLTSKDGCRDLIMRHTGNRNCITVLDLVLKNIMEPIAVQVLKMKMLPTTFDGCIHYICKNMADKKTDMRNDISKQRIRSSEIFNFQIQSLILGSYNQYKRNREHGDKNAKYYCDTRKIVNSVLVGSRLMMPLENINPYEELSCLTRVTPVGPGALASKRSVTRSGRNIHQSYYGNIDPMDTPENDSVGIINHLTIDAAIGNDRGTFGTHLKGQEIGASVLSACTSIIPYVASCDGNRVMMGSSQTRQSIPINGCEQPLVQTGFETIMTNMLTDSYIRKSPVLGTVTKVTDNVVYVQDDQTRRISKIPLTPSLLRSAQGKSALNYFKPTVKEGQRVAAGQIVGEGKHVQNGVISVGTNLLIALMGWKGYSFEDGYIISERIATQKMSSAVYETIEVMLNPDTIVKKIAEEGAITKKGDPLIIRSSKEIEDLLVVEEDEFIEGQYVKPSPGGKIVSIDIYPNISLKKFPSLQKQFEIFKARYEEAHGSFPEKFLINDAGSKAAFPGIKIVFNIERFDNCVIGDKLTNNHGGKGVITLIEKNENMPVTPWGDSVDIILNPIAIINRMNPSSLFELYTGLIAKTAAKQLVSLGTKRSEKSLKIIQSVYQKMDNTKDKVLSRNIIKSFLSMSDKKYSDYIIDLKNRDYVMPILIPPFKQPTKEMIFDTMKSIGLKSRYPLWLPEYKMHTQNDVTVGYMYYKKLEQQSSYKVSARSIGKYSETTSQPIGEGKKGGGQRLGEFDTWSLCAHGADKVLKELLGPLSDDKKTKDEIISDIMQKGEAAFREPKRQSTKGLFDVYMKGMMLDVEV